MKAAADVEVMRFRFEDIVKLLSEDDLGNVAVSTQRWHLPKLPGRLRLARISSGSHDAPLRPKAPPPGRAIPPTPTPPAVPTIPPIPTPPQISARLGKVIALGVGMITALTALILLTLR
jgi:hypothetical protein